MDFAAGFKKKVVKDNAYDSECIAIISVNDSTLFEIDAQVKIHGFNRTIICPGSFFSLKRTEEISQATIVVVDIGDVGDVALIEKTAALLIPASAKRIFIGSNDSIKFAEDVSKGGGAYIHADMLLTKLGSALLAEEADEDKKRRSSLRIAVIGTKGGIGTSSVSYQLLQATSFLMSVPLLLIQGYGGTSDLDLLAASGVKNDGNIYRQENQGLLIESEDAPWNLDDMLFDKYNIVFYDNHIINQFRERVELLAKKMHIIFIVVSRDGASVRNAKLILDEIERNTSINVKENVYIVLNEPHPVTSSELRNDDIEEFIGKKISLSNNYHKKKTVIDKKNPFCHLAAGVFGKKNSISGNSRRSSILSIFRKA